METDAERSSEPTDVVAGDDPSSAVATRALSFEEMASNRHLEPKASHSSPDLRTGDTVGRYVLLEDLARGGMSIVYVAYDSQLDRKVALKVMRPDAHEPPEKAQARLQREAQAMARLAHPNVVRVYDVGVLDRRVYMAMELVEGQTLRDWVNAAKRSWRETVAMLVRAGRGLAAAHGAGLVHLDVKPRNILVGTDGEVRMVDFGLARSPSTYEPDPSISNPSSSDPSISDPSISMPPLDDAVTIAGMVMGTPGYMAPEQLRGAPPDARSDQFAFCVTAWEALYGQRPYGGRRLDLYRAAIERGAIREPPSDAGVPLRLRRVLERGLDAEPERRYPTMQALLDAMAQDPWRRWGRPAMLVAAAATVTVGAWALGRGQADPCGEVGARLAEVWDPQRHEAVRTQLAAVQGEHAAAMSEDVVQRLDQYAERWRSEALDACRAAKVEGRQSAELLDLRDHCLQHRRRALQATTDLILETEPSAAAQWRDAVIGLPDIERCHDLESVQQVGSMPDADQREAVEAADLEIARARALVLAGHYAQAEAVARPALEHALATDHRPTIALAKITLGESLLQLDRPVEAERMSYEGAWDADAERMDALRLEAYVDLIYGLGVMQGRFDEAKNLALGGLVLEERVRSPDRRALILAHLGSIHASAGKTEKARRYFEQSLEVRREAGLPSDLNEGVALTGMGATSLLMGRHEEALEFLRRAHRIAVEAYGATHPGALVDHENIATTLHGMERFEEALVQIDEVIRLSRQAGHTEQSLATVHATRGAILLDLGRLDEAEQALAEARANLENPLRRPVQHAAVRCNQALLALERERFERAAVEATAAREAMIELLGQDHLYVAWTSSLLARAELGRGQPRLALELAAKAMRALEGSDDPNAPDIRSDAALVLARALVDPEVRADESAAEQWGGGRSPAQWLERALSEARAGGRSAEPMLRRAEAWQRERASMDDEASRVDPAASGDPAVSDGATVSDPASP